MVSAYLSAAASQAACGLGSSRIDRACGGPHTQSVSCAGLEAPALVGPRAARPPPHGLGRRTWCAETAAPARSHSAMPALPATVCSLSPAFLRPREYQPRQAAVASLVCQLTESRDRRYRTRTRRRSENKVGNFRSLIEGRENLSGEIRRDVD